jgi:hypothetical protein
MAVYRGQTIISENGRAEVMLGRDCFLRLDEFSEAEFSTAGGARASLRLVAGSVILELVRDRAEEVLVLVDSGQTRFKRKGVYRIDVRPGTAARLRVFRGGAWVSVGDRRQELKARQSVELAEDLSGIEWAESRRDGLDDWNSKRNAEIQRMKRRGLQPDYDVAAAALIFGPRPCGPGVCR